MRLYFFIFVVLLSLNVSTAQTLKITCSEKEKKEKGEEFPDIIRTCYLKNFKFVEISYPDNVGRYPSSAEEVYILLNGKYVKTTNSKVFNKSQAELVLQINDKIQKDYRTYLADSTVRDCFERVDSIPIYKMDDLVISFQKDEIWFEVNWDLPTACMSVNGSIVVFKIEELEKYLK